MQKKLPIAVNVWKIKLETAEVGIKIQGLVTTLDINSMFFLGIPSRRYQNAPPYDNGSVGFNTHHIQASTSLSGGNSDNSVINIHKRAIALQHAGRHHMPNTLFLPLEETLMTLHLIQEDHRDARGTTQTTWEFRTLDEYWKLGL